MSSINGTCTDCSTDSCLITGFLYKTLWQEVDPTNISQGTKFNGNVTVTGCLKTNCIEPYNDAENQVEVDSNLLIVPDQTVGNTENPIRNFELKNRNLAVCDANGNGPLGYPAITTDPRWGYSYMLVHGGSDFRDVVRIRKSQNYNSIFNQFGAALQITAPEQAINEDVTIQLGRDFVSQNNAAIMAFKYAGNGSSLNTFRIDTNGNQTSVTPSFVITMPPPPALGNVGIHVAQPQYPLDVKGDTAIRNITTGNIIMYVDAANGDFTLNASDNTRMMYLDGNSTSFNIGKGSGTVQGTDSIAIGYNAGLSQGNSSIGIGSNAGTSQINNCVAIGVNAGTSQLGDNVAIGTNAGQNNQNIEAIAIGINSGVTSQGAACVAVGRLTGNDTQGNYGIAIGNASGVTLQGIRSVAIGDNCGRINQGNGSIALGYNTARDNQGINAVAIGAEAGRISQGTNAIAIGQFAGQTSQHQNSIILNSSGSILNSSANGQFLVSQIRNNVNTGGQPLFYDAVTKEIHYNQYRVSKPCVSVFSTGTFCTSGVFTNCTYDQLVYGDVGTTGTAPLYTSTVGLSQDALGRWTNTTSNTMVLSIHATLRNNATSVGTRSIRISLFNASNTLITSISEAVSPANVQLGLSTSANTAILPGEKFAIQFYQDQGSTQSLTGYAQIVSLS